MKTVIPYLQFGELGRVAKLVCISIVWCGYAVGDPEASQQQLQQLEEQAQEAQQHGDYQAAIRQYQNILKLRPDLSEERINLALLEHLTGDHAAALADFQFVLKASPQRYVPNLLAGFDLLKLGQPRQALPYLLRAEQLNQKESQPALGLGQAYAALREFDKANSAYYRASLKEPQNSEAYYGLGITYLSLSHDVSDRIAKIGPNAPLAQSLLGEAFLDQGRVKDAIAIYQALLDAGSLPNSMCWFLGTAYSGQGKSSSAETEFQRALSQSPGCLGAHLGLASLRLREGDVPAALDQLDRISKVDNAFLKANLATLWQQFKPDELNGVLQTLTEPPSASDADTRSLTASSLKSWLNGDTSYYVANGNPPPRKAEGSPSAARLLAQGRFSECESALKTARKLGSADELRLAECAFSAGDYRVAFVASSSLLAQNRVSLQALYWRARCTSRLGIAALVQSVRLNPESTRAHLLLAETLRGKRDYPSAEAEYLKTLELEPGFSPARLGLAILYWETSQFDKALPGLQNVLQSMPQDPDTNYMVGAILVQQHQFEDALPYLRKALAGRPEVLAKTHVLLSKVYAAQGLTNQAIAELQQALGEDNDGTYHYQMALLYKKVGDEDAASKALQESEAIRKNKH